jgi:hypothetical protein
VGLSGMAIDRADLDVMLVVLAELYNAGAAAVERVRKLMIFDSEEVLKHAREGSIVNSEGGCHRYQDTGQGSSWKATLEELGVEMPRNAGERSPAPTETHLGGGAAQSAIPPREGETTSTPPQSRRPHHRPLVTDGAGGHRSVSPPASFQQKMRRRARRHLTATRVTSPAVDMIMKMLLSLFGDNGPDHALRS